LPGFFPDNVHPFLVVGHVRRQILEADLRVLSAHMIVKNIPAYSEQQGSTQVVVAVPFKIAGKALLSKIGCQMNAARLTQKIPIKFFPVLSIELTKFIHSIFSNDFQSKGLLLLFPFALFSSF
jgi:hypothetical protein